MWTKFAAVAAALSLLTCATAPLEPAVSDPAAPDPAVTAPGATGASRAGAGTATGRARLLFGGDVMLGRGVASLWRADPLAPVEGIRGPVSDADLAVANLESPLTTAPHVLGPDPLEAPPAAARALAAAGFDAMSIANNHAGDAGSGTVGDTTAALRAVGLPALGLAGAGSPEVVVAPAGGLRVAMLAFDASGTATPGVAAWDDAAARRAVTAARSHADVVTVSIHGGVPYSESPDPFLTAIGERLAAWGADVVWGQGPHVRQPVRVVDPDGDGRPTVLATSLGNLVFDPQPMAGTDRGLLLEVVASAGGVVAVRTGGVALDAGRARFLGWRPPASDVVGFDGDWWAPVVPIRVVPPAPAAPALLKRLDPAWHVERAVWGDAGGDGRPDVVVVFRIAYQPKPVLAAYARPRARFADARGRAARLAVLDAQLRPRWIASAMVRPLAEVAACGGSLAVSYRGLDDPTVTGTGLWRWDAFGFSAPSNLRGGGTPGCADVDGDGVADPVITGRGTT